MITISNQKCHLPIKPKKASENKASKVRELKKLTIDELDALSGARLTLNHNETVVSII